MLLFYLLCLCLAQVYIGFPLLEQLMPAGRVGEQYDFQINNITYATDSEIPVQYNIAGLDWLKFDNNNRSIYGTPTEAGQFSFNLEGSDDTTFTSNTYSILVEDEIVTLNQQEFDYQLKSFGETNGKYGLIGTPGKDFQYKFNNSIFTNIDDTTSFYGKLADHSSLPNWINFNSENLEFSGTIPYVTSDIAPSVDFEFAIIAAKDGFTLAEGIFNVYVGANQLWISDSDVTYNGTLDLEIDLSIPLSRVFLNGNPIENENISLITSDNLPNYLQLDNQSLVGQFPNENTTNYFTVTLTDVFFNTVDFNYSIKSIDLLFSGNFLDLNVTKGEYFEYQIPNSTFVEDDLSIQLDYEATWLNWHEANDTLNGDVPDDFEDLSISVTATKGDREESESFQMKGVVSETSSTPSPSPSSSANPLPIPQNKSSGSSKGLIIGLAVGIPVAVLIILALILACCLKKRKDRKRSESDSTVTVNPDIEKRQVNGDPVDENGIPHRLTSLNLLDLDKSTDEIDLIKEKEQYDARSTSSSMTHVESDTSDYYDAPDKPVKSWRLNDNSDSKNILTSRASNASLSTVNTEQLFSIRLVDDKNNKEFSGPLNLSRDSSANIQRLNSDGDIVENNNNIDIQSIPKNRRTHSQKLEMLLEETKFHRNFSDESGQDSNPFKSTSSNVGPAVKPYDPRPKDTTHDKEASEPQASFTKDTSLNSLNSNDHTIQTESSSFNLLSKVDEPQVKPSKDDHFDQYSYDNEFTATKTDDGDIRWLHANNSRTSLISPYNEAITFNTSNASTLQANIRKSSYSARSFSSTEHLNDNSLNSNGNPKAKLVDFTRKASLRESAYEPDYKYKGESAKIVDTDSD